MKEGFSYRSSVPGKPDTRPPVRQDNGSQQAAQSADKYAAIARSAFSLVIDAQDVRTALQNSLMPGSAAIEVIAGYGAQLWNAAVTDGNAKGNPFTALAKDAEPAQALNPNAAAQVQSLINAGNSSIWIAQSAAQNSKTLNVPAAQSPVSNPFDPQVMSSLTTVEGQSDGDKAQQVAAANLLRLGATTTSSDTKVVIDQLGPDPEAEGAREVSYHFMLSWSTTLVAPRFSIICKDFELVNWLLHFGIHQPDCGCTQRSGERLDQWIGHL